MGGERERCFKGEEDLVVELVDGDEEWVMRGEEARASIGDVRISMGEAVREKRGELDLEIEEREMGDWESEETELVREDATEPGRELGAGGRGPIGGGPMGDVEIRTRRDMGRARAGMRAAGAGYRSKCGYTGASGAQR